MICKHCKTIVSHRLTPSCIFSENLVEIFKILQEFQRYSKKFRRSYKNFRGRLQNSLLSWSQWQEVSQVFLLPLHPVPNGNSIFLPNNYISYNTTDKLDYGVYWSGTLCQNQKTRRNVFVNFWPYSYIVRGGRRTETYSFRPVVNDGAEIESIPEEEASEDELI